MTNMTGIQRRVCKTVGHSNHTIDEFISIIESQSVDTIIDVRSTPYSQYASQFNREPLKKELERVHIGYFFLGDSLGARHTDPSVLFPDGRVNFKKIRKLPKFQEGIDKILSLIENGAHVALMCTEKDPFDCHRFVLISPVLTGKGILVEHIIDASEIVFQKELETRLLENYNKDDAPGFIKLQISAVQKKKVGALRLVEVYELRNKDIAYNGVK
jgi:uncharacterized protein (DUF488 family)